MQRPLAASAPATPSAPSLLAVVATRLLAANRQKEKALFFPNEASLLELFHLIETATSALDVFVFIIPIPEIVQLLIDAHARDVVVRVVCDARELDTAASLAGLLVSAGIEVRAVGNQNDAMHHKYCVADGKLPLNGSINWSISGTERNHKNMIVRRDGPLSVEFSINFCTLWQFYSRK